MAARYAIAQQLLVQGLFELPRRRRSVSIAGLSGAFHQAWVELPPELVRITDAKFKDKATALLILDDGRQLVVELTGSYTEQRDGKSVHIPTISLNISDPAIASMSPDELRNRLTLLWAGACWHSHWQDSELTQKATALARHEASEALDWLDDGEGVDGYAELSISERRETLLHKEVKAILEQEKRIHLPEFSVKVERMGFGSQSLVRDNYWQQEYVSLRDVHLEKRLGRVIPDVMAWVVDTLDVENAYQLLIEVTVTNPINDERLERIRGLNLATLEIDIGRMGGLVTREELVKLVVDEVVGKRWVHHPKAVAEIVRLNTELDTELMYQTERRRRRMAEGLTLQQCAKNYLKAIQMHGNIRANCEPPAHDSKEVGRALELVEDCAQALSLRGYHEAKDVELYLNRGSIVERLLSIQLDTGVGYLLATGWQVINAIRQEREKQRTWQTLYLIAIKKYQPKLSIDNIKTVNEWRHLAWQSLQRGESTYRRSTKYDRLLGVLFPEMDDLLGAGSGIWEPNLRPRNTSPSSNSKQYGKVRE